MIFQDMRYAIRQIRRAPGFAVTVVLTLALSVGVATAVYCVIDAVILRPLPFQDPDKIVAIDSQSPSGYQQPASWPSYVDERRLATSFTALAGYVDFFDVTLETQSGNPVQFPNVRASDNFFQVFAVKPLLGRTFLPGEEQDGKNDIAVLSYEVWQSQFNGDPGVLNKPVKLDGRAYTVVGVMPAGFRFPLSKRNAIYTPIHLDRPWMNGRGNHWLRTIARVKDDMTFQQAQADLAHVFAEIGQAASSDKGRTVHLQNLADTVNSKSQGPLWTLLGAVLAVLAIGCVNVAGLLLARGVKREREMAMRVAIGAGRARLLRQLLTEGVLLALLGAGGGVLLATLLLNLMRTFLIKALSRGAEIHMNWKVLIVAIAVAVCVNLAASLFPALRLSSIDPNRALKAGGNAGVQRGQHRLRSGFVITQVALTLVLLSVSALLLRMVSRYRHVDLGYDHTHILATGIDFPSSRYEGRDVVAEIYQPLLDRVSHLPGVRAAGLISLLPIENWGSNSDIHIAGQPPYPPNQEMLAEGRIVSRGYFDVFGIKLHRGRGLAPGLDGPDNPAATVVVNDAFVKKFLSGNLDPLQQRIDDNEKPDKWTRIVGVVGDVRQDIYQPPMAERDWLMEEIPVKERAGQLSGMSLVVRSDGDPTVLIPALRNALHEVDPTIPFKTPTTMTEVVSETLVFERMESLLFGIFASLALALALVGLYGLVSHEVDQAVRDIGVRMALGATRDRILAMVLRRVLWMLAAGTAAGMLLTVFARKLIGIVIYFDGQKEAGSLLLLGLLLICAGLLAALIPAARAASVEPMQALRAE